VKDLRQALADRPDIAGSFSKLDETLRAPCTDREALQHLAREVLRPLDERASGVVGRIARPTSVGVAATPVALLDAALVLWRSARMVREIAEIYGFRPGLVATSRLARRALSGAASAALIDTVGDIWGAQLTGRVAAAVSPKLAEGVFAAIRMARFGIAVIELCRPVPFLDSDEKPLSRLRGQVAGWMR
jgi:putative membrane protein